MTIMNSLNQNHPKIINHYWSFQGYSDVRQVSGNAGLCFFYPSDLSSHILPTFIKTFSQQQEENHRVCVILVFWVLGQLT